MNNHRLIAWIEEKDGRYTAAFVSEATRSHRAPATKRVSAPHEAECWVKREAAALGGVPVMWVDQR